MIDTPIVELDSGKIAGSVKKSACESYDYHAFQGIPYAAPPLGDLRFRDPIPIEKWQGVKETTQFGPICAQIDSLNTCELVGCEDCLYLNVYSKTLDKNARQPVMVWIHGGGFIEGDGSDAWYGPEFLLRKDVVLVTLNYRLGVLGFLNLEDEVAPGNQGLKDQVMALRWVKNNIANFGGDPQNVTIFGESAGGASTHYHTMSPLSKGLFHKAISQSGLATSSWAFNKEPRSFAIRLCKYLGFESTKPSDMVKFLRTVDCLELADAQQAIRTNEERVIGIFSFGPSLDDKSINPFLPGPPEDLTKLGVDVPFMFGYTSREGLFLLPNPQERRRLDRITMGTKMSDYEELDKKFGNYIHPNMKKFLEHHGLTEDAVRQMYFGDEPISPANQDRLADLWGDFCFADAAHDLAKIQIEKKFSSYMYVFSYDKSFSLMKYIANTTLPGVPHADELGYLFSRRELKSPAEVGTPGYKVMEIMTEMWTNFAKTGNPTPTITDVINCKWRPCMDKDNLECMNIDDHLRIETLQSMKDQLLAFAKKR